VRIAMQATSAPSAPTVKDTKVACIALPSPARSWLFTPIWIGRTAPPTKARRMNGKLAFILSTCSSA
jgi:hypothetical protein